MSGCLGHNLVAVELIECTRKDKLIMIIKLLLTQRHYYMCFHREICIFFRSMEFLIWGMIIWEICYFVICFWICRVTILWDLLIIADLKSQVVSSLKLGIIFGNSFGFFINSEKRMLLDFLFGKVKFTIMLAYYFPYRIIIHSSMLDNFTSFHL